MDVARLDPRGHDLDKVADLIYETQPELFARIFGRNPAHARTVLKRLVQCERNTFAYPHVQVATVDSSVAGILVAYCPKSFDSGAEAADVVRCAGLTDFARMLFWGIALSGKLRVDETERDDLYISNVSVAIPFRRRGVGTELLRRAEEIAQAEGCNRMSLHVSFDNPGAKSLYERYGFVATARRSVLFRRRTGNYVMEYSIAKEYQE